MVNPDIWRLLFSREGGKGTRLNQEMSKAYDIAFGIFSHAQGEWTPLKSVAMHPAEDPWQLIGRPALIRQYDTCGIERYMSLDAFLKSDFPVSDTLIRQAMLKLRRQAEEQEVEEEKLRQAELEARKGK